MLQVLEEKPDKALDLLETSYMAKRTAFTPMESAPLVPTSVSRRTGREGRGIVLLKRAPPGVGVGVAGGGVSACVCRSNPMLTPTRLLARASALCRPHPTQHEQ